MHTSRTLLTYHDLTVEAETSPSQGEMASLLNEYYVIKESGRVVAGLQAYPVSCHIVDFGNGMANQQVRLLVKIPWVWKRINPDEIKLLAFDGIYCEPGCESTLYEIFRKQQKLGIMHRVLSSFTADVRMRFINLPEETRQWFLDQPTYIPTYDNS
jgi:hypothetical protein